MTAALPWIEKPESGEVSLDDKWTLSKGRIVINGTQAIVRVLLSQSDLDRRAGLNTAGYISGYRGSPLGGLDTTLWSIAKRLTASNILFHPGVNEDIAATSVRGTQQLDQVPGALRDGVYAAWYGKGPGVDRSGDAFKHGNYAGTHRNGGVLVFYGDDHAGKSSSVAFQSEQALTANLIPSLYPSNPRELLEYGLLGFAMSRYSGSWVGIKCVNEVVEQTASIDVDLAAFAPALPPLPGDLPLGLHAHQGAFNPLRDEQIVLEHRLPLIERFVKANKINRTIFRARIPSLGIVTVGKTYGDVKMALSLLGLDDDGASRLGVSLYKVGCIWPLEREGIESFAQGHATLFVIEEKKSFLEQQIASILINRIERPLLIGKLDEQGNALLSSSLPLTPLSLALAIADRLQRLGISDDTVRAVRQELLETSSASPAPVNAKRSPYFCSGCPHNRSTQVPEGSLSMTGIGCHTMVNFVRPQSALLPTQMGGEGGNWLGLAPFTATNHIFQNMGDGTYYHSGLLAIRAAVASGVNITYKILYNDAVAMTGGQPVDGPISVSEIAHQVRHEGVKRIALLSDDPKRHRRSDLPPDVTIDHRDRLDALQHELRETPGCSVLIYEQTCAAEKRRRRKRGTYSDPPKRLFISEDVCEGCGDCSVQSTCVSLLPLETEFGRKRKIDQSSCNKDYSCVNGFCPSFITIHDAEPRKPRALSADESKIADLRQARVAPLEGSTYNLMVAGIGGTGVVTVGALLGMAAHLDGKACSLFDMTGLAQKNGAVYSHIRIAQRPEEIFTQRLGGGEADVLLAFDLVAALSPEASSTVSGRTQVLANAGVTPTVAFQFDRDASSDTKSLIAQLERLAGSESVCTVDASDLALKLTGDSMAANLFMVGIATQRGILPISVSAIEAAVRLNAVGIDMNLTAFRLGRLFVDDQGRLEKLASRSPPPTREIPSTLSDVIAHRAAHLTAYQNTALAERFKKLVDEAHAAEEKAVPGSTALALQVARKFSKLLAYKDEYEVARLLTSEKLQNDIKRQFKDGARYSFNLAPPFLPRGTVNGRPRKMEFSGRIRPLLAVLARLRVLRGTVFDPFGYSAERRMERRLITDYERLVKTVLPLVTALNIGAAIELLGAVDQVRGFGPVKAAAAASYRDRVSLLEQAFLLNSVT
jgi:indolepyruvate ferredoxin oxidoreductase